MKSIFTLLFSLLAFISSAQRILQIEVLDAGTGAGIAGATISVGEQTVVADKRGFASLETTDSILTVTAVGYESRKIELTESEKIQVILSPLSQQLDGIVVSGTMKAVRRLDSPVAVEVYSPEFFKKNPSPSIFESLQNVNGVRPQINCSVCNTGDIHINGLEGPYTMVTIDGMPIVSSLASVYGLFGIPTQLIERVEIVKGPASGLYGAEAIGGLINIITRSPDKAPQFTGSLMSTSWAEHNLDLGTKFGLGKKANSLLGINYFRYANPQDNNADQFTDLTLQHRISVFNKVSFNRKADRVASIAGRYFYEDRWGGDMRWKKEFRGTDSIYGESIYTSRWELMGNYQLPVDEKLMFSYSASGHHQNSYYGTTAYNAIQRIVFGQLTWDKNLGSSHSLLTGTAFRYNYYDDNSTATIDTFIGLNAPEKYMIPGIFIQDEWKLARQHLLLLGMRYDYHQLHGSIFTPRLAWKWALADRQTLRLNAGTGFRVVSLFTEEHAALTGARAVEILEELKPEKSYNINLNYTRQYHWNGNMFNIDLSTWYSYFTNQIIPDYDTDPQKIFYKNLDGHAISRGVTINLELNAGRRLKALAGLTLQEVRKCERNSMGKMESIAPVLTENWSGTWSVSYSFPAIRLSMDYTGNIYGPMRLPLASDLDPRPANSPVWSIQNIQFTELLVPGLELFAGVKNLLNWTPAKNVPFLIARSHDPFDKQVEYGADGSILATPANPYALSFDPAYSYAPNQGRRVFVGIRYTVR